jgi:hypothetical protein
MQSSPLPVSPEKALLERMRTLYPQLHDVKCHTSEYEHLIAQIHQLALAYCKLVEAKQGIRPNRLQA